MKMAETSLIGYETLWEKEKLLVMSRNFSHWLRNTVGKGEVARYEQFLLFPQCFQKTCTADT